MSAAELTIATTRSPYTGHGHLVPGFSGEGWDEPPGKARCGGPAICGKCAVDAAALREAHGLPPSDVVPESEFVNSTDAMVWARAFCSRVRTGLDATDEGWLVGWFANAMAAQERATRPATAGDAATRAADAIADLSDALVGIRERVDRVLDAEASDKQEDEERAGRRAPAEWQDGLIAIERWLSEVRFDVTISRLRLAEVGDAEQVAATVPTDSAKRIAADLDKRLRDGAWQLRSAMRTLGGDPPKDLRRDAEAFADRHGAQGPARVAAVEAYLAGAGVDR